MLEMPEVVQAPSGSKLPAVHHILDIHTLIIASLSRIALSCYIALRNCLLCNRYIYTVWLYHMLIYRLSLVLQHHDILHHLLHYIALFYVK